MRKAAVRALMTNAAVGHGADLAGQVGATAVEMMRTRRDPAVIAERRRKAARRRLRAWTAGAIVTGAVATTGAVQVFDGVGTVDGGAIGALVFLVALLAWCIVGIVRSSIDLRARTRMAAALPAPQPPRPAVAGAIKPEMGRLDGYSDGLRQLVGMIGIVDDDAGVRNLRDEILAAADTTEARLRRQAMDLTGVLRARRSGPAEAVPQLDATAQSLRRQIHRGVDGYGALVSAASEAVAASRALADQGGVTGLPSAGGQLGSGTAPQGELQNPTDQLRALAAGMRELTQH